MFLDLYVSSGPNIMRSTVNLLYIISLYITHKEMPSAEISESKRASRRLIQHRKLPCSINLNEFHLLWSILCLYSSYVADGYLL